MALFDELKSIGKVLQEAGKIEQYQQILETQEKLLEMQKRISDLEYGNKELKEKLKIKENIFFENNAYWLKNEKSKKDGPFCTRCYDKDKNLIRMRHRSSQQWSRAHYNCPECRNNYLA